MTPLPIDPLLPRIEAALRGHSAVVLQAPPGSGKTTRVPLSLLDAMPAQQGRIILLEPRRLAAVSAARWMARMLGEEVGQTVGYSIRFDSRTSERTRVEVVTEGILTRRILADPALEGVAAVIFDEFHERSLQTDLALTLCLDVRSGLREDLKLLVMSATLDAGPIAALLGDAPVISAEGRIFPVEERYGADDRQSSIESRMTAAVRRALGETAGDILAFLPGAGEIRRTAERLAEAMSGGKNEATLHPLYGDLPFAQQEQAILPARDNRRKVVLATNIAETSLTIEGVRVVIDGGFTRALRYDPSTGMNRLVTIPVSRAAALQRQGRAGRLGPGVCYRLYSPHTFASLIPHAPPEILVSDMASLALELACWGVRDPQQLSWLDPPPEAAWRAARELLLTLGALDKNGQATPAGRRMVRLPLHPRLGRLLLRAEALGCVTAGADMAALLSERDIFRRADFDTAGGREQPDISDRLERIDAWRQSGRAPQEVDPGALQTIDRVSRQLIRLIGKRRRSSPEDRMTSVPRLLLSAYPDRIAKRREEGVNRFLLRGGQGVVMPRGGTPAGNAYVIAVQVDAGQKADGVVHAAEPVPEALIREEMSDQIEVQRRVEWDRREGRIVSSREERLGSLLLSAKPATPEDRETMPILYGLIRTGAVKLPFGQEARQLQGRVALMKRAFPEEAWPDLSEAALLETPETWLMPFLAGIRTQAELLDLDVRAALLARLTWPQRSLLDERAPAGLAVPSGHRVALDYDAGETPVLAVKLQEMFGLADTPAIAGGRVKVLLHLLSPARRPLQITQDLKGFWDGSYHQVKKELKGRYPKHPWPDDPWNAVPTRRTKNH
jgi:ATP-dependent helicase HrpB